MEIRTAAGGVVVGSANSSLFLFLSGTVSDTTFGESCGSPLVGTWFLRSSAVVKVAARPKQHRWSVCTTKCQGVEMNVDDILDLSASAPKKNQAAREIERYQSTSDRGLSKASMDTGHYAIDQDYRDDTYE